MEEKQVLLSSFAIWAGLNLGVGIYAGVKHYNQSNQLHEDQIVKGLMKLVTNGKDYDVTFDKFPYYLRYCKVLGYFLAKFFTFFLCVLNI